MCPLSCGVIQRRCRPAATAAAVVMCLAAIACGSSPAAPTGSPPPAPLTDSVSSVTSMSPAPGTTLQAGQTVTFAGTPGYVLAATLSNAALSVSYPVR